jgi:hypothetical protein
VIQTIQARIEAALDRVVAWIRTAARRLLEMGTNAVAGVVQWWRARKQFTTASGETHSIYFQGEGAAARLTLASDPMQIAAWVDNFSRRNIPANKRAALAQIRLLLAEADRIKNATTSPAGRTMEQVMEDLKTQIQLVIGGDILASAKAFPAFNNKYFKPSQLVEFVSNAEGIAESTVATRIRAWKGSNDLKELASNPNDPYKQFTFHKSGGSRSVPDASKRQLFGFSDNVDKESGDGLTVMLKGFSGPETLRVNTDVTPAQLNANRRVKDWVKLKGRFYSPRTPNSFFTWADAIMGHDDRPGHGGASGYWNSTGHTKTLGENRTWNRDPVNYWGPEHHRESSGSGGSAARYNDPVAPASNPMWWHSGHSLWPGHRYPNYNFEFSAYYNLSGGAV